MKIILFGFDGLRTDSVTKNTMPRLYEFLNSNTNFKNNRAVFPAETYVNHPSIFTGFLPEAHGLVANAFMDSSVSRQDYFLGSFVEKIEHFDKVTGGRLFRVPSVSEVFSRNGLSHFSVCSNTAGSTRLLSHRAKEFGFINISVNGYKYAIPDYLRAAYGTDPESGAMDLPDIKGLDSINRIVNDVFDREGLADMNVVWYGEPDHSFHAFGVGAEESLAAIKKADTCFGEIIDKYWKNDVQIIVCSDHGHISVKGHFDLTKALEEKGFKHSNNLDDMGSDFTLLWGYSGNIYAHRTEVIPDLVKALQEMPEIGMLFTDNLDGVNGMVDGTFSKRLVAGEGSRAGDIRFILKTFREKDVFGFNGTCFCPDFIKINGGIHGGLHPSEINCLLAFGGNSFKKGASFDSVSGLIDITPTIYSLFGIRPEIIPQGRVLSEAFSDVSDKAPEADVREYKTSKDGFTQKLKIAYVNNIPYFIEGV